MRYGRSVLFFVKKNLFENKKNNFIWGLRICIMYLKFVWYAVFNGSLWCGNTSLFSMYELPIRRPSTRMPNPFMVDYFPQIRHSGRGKQRGIKQKLHRTLCGGGEKLKAFSKQISIWQVRFDFSNYTIPHHIFAEDIFFYISCNYNQHIFLLYTYFWKMHFSGFRIRTFICK